MDSRFAAPRPRAHTYTMTNTSRIETIYLAVVLTAAVAATMLTQAVMQVIAQGLSDSSGVRVAPATACSISQDGAHFTGCSSIL